MAEVTDGSDVVVFPRTIGRGGSLSVRFVDVERFRPARVELLLVERKLATTLNYKRNHSRVVATALVAPGMTSVVLAVPDWVPDTYSGDTVGWDYELRAVGGRVGPDTNHITPVRIEGGARVNADADDFTDARRGAPIRRVGALGRNTGGGQWFGVGLFALVGAAVAAFGATGPHVVPLVFGLGFIVMAAGLGLSIALAKPLAIDDLVVEVPDDVIRSGEPIEIRVLSPIDSTIEIGIEAVEIYVDGGSNKRIGITKTVIERFRPLTEPTVRIPAYPDDRGGYAGEEVSLHWVVAARMIGTEPKKRRSHTRRIPISRID